jgi:hypothetical protein
MTQQLHAGYDAILAEGKPANAVITSGAESPSALVALDDRRVLWVISAIQHYWSQLLRIITICFDGFPVQHRSASVSA